MKRTEDVESGSDASVHQKRVEGVPPYRSDCSSTEFEPRVPNIFSTNSAMLSYEPYVSSVEELAEAALRPRLNFEASLIPAGLLDGQARIALRKSIPLLIRRERGAFFSSSDLRVTALQQSQSSIDPSSSFLDPAVGGGDLLIEVARHVSVRQDLAGTIEISLEPDKSYTPPRGAHLDFIRHNAPTALCRQWGAKAVQAARPTHRT